jgi:hypothetical protein
VSFPSTEMPRNSNHFFNSDATIWRLIEHEEVRPDIQKTYAFINQI